MVSARLIDKVYYKEVRFDLLFPVRFNKFILRIVRPVITWLQSFKNIRAWADSYGNLSLAGTSPFSHMQEFLSPYYSGPYMCIKDPWK